jgi:hypothetical protein
MFAGMNSQDFIRQGFAHGDSPEKSLVFREGVSDRNESLGSLGVAGGRRVFAKTDILHDVYDLRIGMHRQSGYPKNLAPASGSRFGFLFRDVGPDRATR